jgi:methionyl-tRNA formyltransferase
MRLVFFGSGAFGLPTLAALAREHELLGVVSQPDRPAGRGGKVTPTPIAAFAQEHLRHVPLLRPEKCNQPEIVEAIRAWPADAWVVIAFGQKLSKLLLADRFAINLHASLLPRWRGAAPINAAILGGDTRTGNSVITLADRMDAGLILGTSERDIDPDVTAGKLHDLLSSDGPALVERVLAQHRTSTLTPTTQDESLVTIAGKLSKDDDNIDFHQPADFLRRQVHALTPWPGISVVTLGPGESVGEAPIARQPMKLLRVRTLPNQPITPDPARPISPAGTLIDLTRGLVACGHDSLLQLVEIQPSGKRAMSWGDYARGAGRSLVPGSRLMAAREAL